MSDTVIRVESLWKKYRLGLIGTGTLRHDLNRWWHRVCGKPDPYALVGMGQKRDVQGHKSEMARDTSDASSPPLGDDEIWALRDVSLEVKRGEILGVIGSNGAGKSTLLKILSRVTAPTSGEVKVKGRIASLLEVGTGFHPELTGRENIFLNGAILGMAKDEIKRKFDEIVAFAEVDKFIDTPVKRYSSGMYVRLAFAVAAHLDPEILVVDEVLAVGDASFQKKCLGKMGDVAQGGRTVLFVSHNMTAVKTLCSRSMLLEHGALQMAGETPNVINAYIRGSTRNITKREWPTPESAPGTDGVRFKSVKLVAADSVEVNQLTVKTAFDIVIELWVFRSASINLSLPLNLISGETVFVVASPVKNLAAGVARYVCHVPEDLLNDGAYAVNILVVEDGSEVRFRLSEALTFEIHEVARAGYWLGKWPGFVRPQMRWTCEQPVAGSRP